ncbi:MAG: hypothetical protein IPK29_09830 [Betaproteobacteria bacterium]|nr:hypothetical protein [Betaproteobacteria bacterium]
MYRSPLFDGARHFAETRCDSWFILSAKHGLLQPTEKVDPYNESLYQLDEAAQEDWARKVYGQLESRIEKSSAVVFLAGVKYRSKLQKHLQRDGVKIYAPMAELGIGRQVAWLQKLIREANRLRDLDRLYALISRLASRRNCIDPQLVSRSSKTVPQKGIYFFFQQDEFRMTQPLEMRVVRIGTHAVSKGSKSTLWNRLRTHRGAVDGSGNHRGSIFRLHVGDALLRKLKTESRFPEWGVGQSANAAIRDMEKEMELEVSKTISSMPVQWLNIEMRRPRTVIAPT